MARFPGEAAEGAAPAAGAGCAGQFCYDTACMKAPWVIAHRGASGYAPENTLAAFRKAAELGARFIETDLRLSRDMHFVAIHDATLERTTNGRGGVNNRTLAELRQLDAGSWFNTEFAGERIPTLEEIFEFSGQADIGFYLEIKSGAAWELHSALAGAMSDASGASRAVVISFDTTILEKLMRLEATMMTGLLFDQPLPDAIERGQRLGTRQLLPRGDLLTRELVERAHEADLQVITWTLDEPVQMRAAIAAGVDGIMTNYPDRLRDIIEKG